MEHFVSLQMWAVLVAAPCVIAGFLGDLNGAARMRRMIEAGERGDIAEHQPKVSGKSAAERVPTMRRANSTKSHRLPGETHSVPERCGHEDTFRYEPDLHDSVCLRNPISERVLQHYRGSISELGRRNALSRTNTALPTGKERTSPGAFHTPS